MSRRWTGYPDAEREGRDGGEGAKVEERGESKRAGEGVSDREKTEEEGGGGVEMGERRRNGSIRGGERSRPRRKRN